MERSPRLVVPGPCAPRRAAPRRTRLTRAAALCLALLPAALPCALVAGARAEDAPAGAGARPAPPPAPVPAPRGGLDDDEPAARPQPPAVDPALTDPSLRDDGDPTAPVVPDPRRPIEGLHPFGPEQRMHLDTDDVVGRMKVYEGDDGKSQVYVFAGNPHLYGGDYSVKARTLVLWFDKAAASDFAGFFGGIDAGSLDGGAKAGAGKGGAKAGAAKPGAGKASPEAAPGTGAAAGAKDPKGGAATGDGTGRRRDVIPPSILAIYAEGAVEFRAGLHAFRAMQLVFEPKTGHMLVVEARYDGAIEAGTGTEARLVPIFVRAERARGLAQGFVTFDRAEVSTSRANDRIALRVDTLTIEEYGQAVADEPVVLGFARPGTQRFDARGIQVRAERVPLVYVPRATFGGSDGFQELPARIRRASLGSRSSLGRYGFVGFGGEEGPRRWLDWTVDVGGYTKRGPAVGTDLIWNRDRVKGRLQTFSMYDATGEDRSGYDAGAGFRGMTWFENRFDPTPSWRFDTEANVFTDRGVYSEYFESDSRTHKDRETYGRVRWKEGGATAFATAGVHARRFVTESYGQPEVQFWSESVPLPSPPGGPSFDLSTEARSGAMIRRFDVADDADGYEAWRTDVTERVYAPFSVGDVRVSPFVGAHFTSYEDRDDGGDDLQRGALEAGVRANLQFWKDFGAWGGPWTLDGLRHVVDVDVGAFGRYLDDTNPEDAPFFDRIDGAQDHTEVFAEVRSRVMTRRSVLRRTGRVREDVTLLDARLRVSYWPDGIGPYGRTGPGEAEGWFSAEIAPRTAWIEGSFLTDFEGPDLRRAAIGVQWNPNERFGLAAGLRNVKGALFGPWVDVYWQWNEKWGARLSAVEDFERRGDGGVRITLMRFSPDHLIELGPVLRDHGNDVGFYFNVAPSIGGRPVREPFQPREIFALEAPSADSR